MRQPIGVELDLAVGSWTEAGNLIPAARPAGAATARSSDREPGWFEPVIACAMFTMVLSAALAGARADVPTFCAILVAVVGAATIVRSELGFWTQAGGRWETAARGSAVTLTGILVMTTAMLFLLT